MTEQSGSKAGNFIAGFVVFAALAASPSALAAIDMFLKLDGVPGESRDSVHSGEIDVLAWSWGATSTGTWNKPDCAKVQDIFVTKYVDRGSPKMMGSLSSGRLMANARLVVRKAGQTPIEYLVIDMTNVIVTSISTGGASADDKLTEKLSLNFAWARLSYTETSPTGTPGLTTETIVGTTCRAT